MYRRTIRPHPALLQHAAATVTSSACRYGSTEGSVVEQGGVRPSVHQNLRVWCSPANAAAFHCRLSNANRILRQQMFIRPRIYTRFRAKTTADNVQIHPDRFRQFRLSASCRRFDDINLHNASLFIGDAVASLRQPARRRARSASLPASGCEKRPPLCQFVCSEPAVVHDETAAPNSVFAQQFNSEFNGFSTATTRYPV